MVEFKWNYPTLFLVSWGMAPKLNKYEWPDRSDMGQHEMLKKCQII